MLPVVQCARFLMQPYPIRELAGKRFKVVGSQPDPRTLRVDIRENSQ